MLGNNWRQTLVDHQNAHSRHHSREWHLAHGSREWRCIYVVVCYFLGRSTFSSSSVSSGFYGRRWIVPTSAGRNPISTRRFWNIFMHNTIFFHSKWVWARRKHVIKSYCIVFQNRCRFQFSCWLKIDLYPQPHPTLPLTTTPYFLSEKVCWRFVVWCFVTIVFTSSSEPLVPPPGDWLNPHCSWYLSLG